MQKPGKFSGLLAIVLLYASISVADPVPVQWDTVATHEGMYIEGGTPEGECVGLVVSNHGEMGYAGLGEVNLDFRKSGLECGPRPEDAVYLYSGSPFVIIADDALGTNAGLTCSYAQTDQSKLYSWTPVDDLGDMAHGLAVGGEYDSVYTGRFVNRDATIAMERTYYAPRGDPDNSSFVVTLTKLYSNNGQPHEHVTIGSLIDWNIPSETPNVNISGYSYGVVVMGTDVTFTSCQPFDSRWAAEIFGGFYTHTEWTSDSCHNDSVGFYGIAAFNQRLAADTILARDGDPLVPPQPDAQAWWDDLGASYGISWDVTPGNQAIWLTYKYDYSLTANDTLYFWTILATALNTDAASYNPAVRYAKAWFSHVVRGCPGTCCEGRVGDINGVGGDQPTIGDVSMLITVMFINPIDPSSVWFCLEEADVNGSGSDIVKLGDITIGDLSVLIDHLFITGPSLELLPCSWW